MLFIAYAFKGQAHVFAGLMKTVSHLSCRTSAILKYFCPLLTDSISRTPWSVHLYVKYYQYLVDSIGQFPDQVSSHNFIIYNIAYMS